jgi:integrase
VRLHEPDGHECRSARTIITPEQFERVLEALLDATMRLLAETKIETGLRWSELTELRMSDIDLATRMLTVSRAVVEVNASSIQTAAGSSSRTTRRTVSTDGSS